MATHTDVKRAHAQPLSRDLEEFIEAVEGETFEFGQLVDVIGRRAFVPLMLIPAVLNVLPTGAIPGVTLVTGSIIVLSAGQLLAGRERPWLPRRLLQTEIDRQKAVRSIEKWLPRVRRLERLLKPRLEPLSQPPFTVLNAALCLVMGLMALGLLWVPLGSLFPSLTVVALSLGMLARDGIATLAGYGLAVAALAAAAVAVDAGMS